MKLHVCHTFPCDPDRFWEMYWDDGYDTMVREGSTVDQELVEERTEGALVVRRLRFTPQRELPAPVARLVGGTKLIYEQENRWDPVARTIQWKVIPTLLPGKLDAAGRLHVQPAAGGCERVVDGEITVNVRFIGGRIEQAVVEAVQRTYDQAATVGRRWLAARG